METSKTPKIAQLSKDAEITFLYALCTGNGYFASTFGADLDVMIQNIKNDFPVEMGTSITKRIDSLILELKVFKTARSHDIKSAVDAVRVQNDAVIDALLDSIICNASTLSTNPDLINMVIKSLDQAAIKANGQAGLINRKRRMKIALSDADLDFLIMRMNNEI